MRRGERRETKSRIKWNEKGELKEKLKQKKKEARLRNDRDIIVSNPIDVTWKKWLLYSGFEKCGELEPRNGW
jgi:hypothetical protein